ncbi:hypothetical protein JL720_2503 [Aureococcus anophagefferens]|nr:hypothetical protein JL720_2503 [Aureococcus anophagefferens]
MPQGGLGIAPGPALCPALRLSEAFEERGDGNDRRRVSYGTASIHYFPVAPSDNPAVSSGVGVALAGAAELCEVVEVEDHRPLGARRRPVGEDEIEACRDSIARAQRDRLLSLPPLHAIEQMPWLLARALRPEARRSQRHPEEFPVPDPKDASTPDAWVKRNPALVRLTGRHPFNVEPPLPLLEAHGHSTPASLHYVRNHGAVPVAYGSAAEADAVYDGWRCEVLAGGGVEAKSLSMADLEKFPKVVVPSLLVCAGNRRKEQNMIKRTIGFNWGAAGLGMSEWGGCHLVDVLASLGAPTDPAAWDGGGHVCFRGPDKELPGGADGSYGTSLTLRYVMDKSNDASSRGTAWEQNGARLQADHGFPLRILIPGFIGGRMVKWLKEIKISPEQSDNHYHFKDNRVLPVNVTPEQAEAEGWWFKPDYIINELNINSAMFHPGHGEIIRVEVTLDGGASWFLVKDGDVTHPPNTPNKAGKYWGWCFWKITVPTADLLKAPNVACRAWDAAMNTQPSNLTWNVMGMLNNPWFTVVKHFDAGPAGTPVLVFEHPTLAGAQAGGWMTDDARRLAGASLTPESAGAAAMRDMHAGAARRRRRRRRRAAPRPRQGHGRALGNTYTLADVAKHDTPQDCWIAVNGVVYDTNPYLAEHPGGASPITMNAGTDATDEFTAIHSRKAWTLLDKYAIGTLAADGGGAAAAATPPRRRQGRPVALNPKKRVKLKLAQRVQLSDDSFRLTFALPSDDHVLGLPTGQHVLVYGQDAAGKSAYRPLPPRFPDGGALSQHLCDRIAVGSEVEFRGPMGEIEYLGGGAFEVHDDKGVKKRIAVKRAGLIAGGTGLTPMLQLITAVGAEVAADAPGAPALSFLLGNRTEADILCRDEIEAAQKAGAVDLHYTLDKPPPGWPHHTGFIDDAMLAATMPKPAKDTYFFCCGPPPMIKSALAKLEAAGHPRPTLLSCAERRASREVRASAGRPARYPAGPRDPLLLLTFVNYAIPPRLVDGRPKSIAAGTAVYPVMARLPVSRGNHPVRIIRYVIRVQAAVR